MNRYESLFSRCRSIIKLITCAWIDTSRAETGSSAMISLGLSASARAIDTRWRCPPENSWGKLFICAGLRPTCSNNWATRSAFSLPRTRPCTSSGSATMSPADMRGLSEENGS